MVAQQRAVGVGEVLPVRPSDDGHSVAHRLDWVLAAALDQRAADEGERRQRVKRAELADSVGDVDLRMLARHGAEGALRHRETKTLEPFGNGGAALGVARRDDSAEAFKVARELAVRGGDDLLLALMRARGKEYRPAAQCILETL